MEKNKTDMAKTKIKYSAHGTNLRAISHAIMYDFTLKPAAGSESSKTR